MAKGSFRKKMRRERQQHQHQPIPPMPDLDDPIYDKLDELYRNHKDRPPNAPEFFIFLVDGHNCIHKLMAKEQLEWEDARNKFLRDIVDYRLMMWNYYQLMVEFKIYLDDYKSRWSSQEFEEGVTLFNSAVSGRRDAADIEIVEMVRLAVNPAELVVASSDRYCRQVEHYGAKLFKADVFLQMLRIQLPPDYIGDYHFA
ncbi:MAG: hypothetical protein D6675_10110 [Gemmatimonadetes bacterium]|nr:MAG: hypothetical protein D6675_10110 [Gemmatimonadota bacterium]